MSSKAVLMIPLQFWGEAYLLQTQYSDWRNCIQSDARTEMQLP